MANKVRKTKDTDFLHISARVRALELGLLTRERLDRMIEAKTDAEALKVLSESGYGDVSAAGSALERALSERRASAFAELARAPGVTGLLDVFRLKYDYHNIKVILKAHAQCVIARELLSRAGSVEPEILEKCLKEESFDTLPSPMGEAFKEARDTLAATGDPQRADFILDRACLAQQLDTAISTGSEFLTGYAKLLIDSANLRGGVRALRMKKNRDFINQILVSGGKVDAKALLDALCARAGIAELFDGTRLKGAAALAEDLLESGRLTAFEKQCEDALIGYLGQATRIPFGEEPVIAYAGAIENEITAVRIIMAGRLAGLRPDAIRERLRETYV